jgi:hypothetical protein
MPSLFKVCVEKTHGRMPKEYSDEDFIMLMMLKRTRKPRGASSGTCTEKKYHCHGRERQRERA